MPEEHPGSKSQIGGDLEPRQLAGREYEVTLHETVEYRLTVLAGPEEQSAVEEAVIQARHGDESPLDRDVVHTEVESVEDIWADDHRAERCLTWLDGPTAPSEETFWDDSYHFPEGYDDVE